MIMRSDHGKRRASAVSAGSADWLAFRLEFSTMWTLRKNGEPQIRGVTFPLLQKSHEREGAMPSGRRPHDVLAG
jgi:hypothetical protein